MQTAYVAHTWPGRHVESHTQNTKMFQSDLHVDDCNSNISYQFCQFRCSLSHSSRFLHIFLDKCANFDMLCWILPNKHYTQTHMDILAFLEYIVLVPMTVRQMRDEKRRNSSCHVYICDSGTKNRQHSHSKTSQPTDSRSLLFHYYTCMWGMYLSWESPSLHSHLFSAFLRMGRLFYSHVLYMWFSWSMLQKWA